MLNLKDNGNFPVILSAMKSSSLGEILMSYSGQDCFVEFELCHSIGDKSLHNCFNLKQLADCAHQLISQLEVFHKLGYTHGDLKFQNICYDKILKRYTIIDFAIASKICNKKGDHNK